MKYIYSLSLICFFALPLLSSGDNTHLIDDAGSKVRFELVNGLILVPITVDGVQGTYIFDTGAPNLTLNRKVSEPEFTLFTHGRSHDGQAVFVKGIQYGAISQQGVRAWAMDLTFLEHIIDRPISGIVGTNIFRDCDVLIDFESEEIQLITSKSKDLSFSTSSYYTTLLKIDGFHNQLPLVDVIIDGEIKSMIFDTGATISVLNNMSSMTLGERNEMAIKVGSVKINNAPFISLNTAPEAIEEGSSFDGILSVSSLNSAKVLLSYSTSRIFLFWPKSSS